MASPETLTSSLEQLQTLGLYNGVGDIYLAMMTKEGTETEKPTFTKPQVAAEGVEVGLTPVYSEGSQSASNRTVRKVKILMGYDVRIAYPRMLAAIRDYILAHTRDAKGGSVMGEGRSTASIWNTRRRGHQGDARRRHLLDALDLQGALQ